MLSTLRIVFLFVLCQTCVSTRIPSLDDPTDGGLNCTSEHFRNIYSSFPCSDGILFDKIYNIVKTIRGPKIPGRLEADEAEMELLYLMVIGKTANVSPTKWYLIFEKTADAYDKSLPFREERLRLNEKMLQIYLTSSQIRRFKVFTKLLIGDTRSIDIYALLRYLYGFPIGLAIGVPEAEITDILETYISMDEVANQLGRLAGTLCRKQHPNFTGSAEQMVREVIRNLLTRSF